MVQVCGQAARSPPLQLIGMNPQALPPYPRDPVSNSKFASWDYPIGNIERWHAKTSLDQHYAAGKLQPTEYGTRMVGIMGATMWSHLVVIFADLPAPGPAYDGRQLLKACQMAQRAQPVSPSVIRLSIVILGFIFFALMLITDPLGIILSIAISIFALCIVISMATVNKYQRVYQNFSNQLNLQQRALLDEAANEEYAQYYWRQQQQQQIQNMFNNINRQY